VPTRNVVLTDHQAALIERLVESARHQNASAVLRAGPRLLEHRERVEALEAAIAEGEASLARGDDTMLAGAADIRACAASLAPRV